MDGPGAGSVPSGAYSCLFHPRESLWISPLGPPILSWPQSELALGAQALSITPTSVSWIKYFLAS